MNNKREAEMDDNAGIDSEIWSLSVFKWAEGDT
jgi:hypothetical protein